MASQEARTAVLETQIVGLRREIDLLREFLTAQVDNQNKATEIAMAAAKEATSKADAAHEKRFEGVNEFRTTLSDQQKTFVTKAEIDIRVANLDKEMEEISRWRHAMDQKVSLQTGRGAGFTAIWGYFIAGVGLIATVVGTAMLFFVNR
jgi:small-conductance mechanosensitive channel